MPAAYPQFAKLTVSLRLSTTLASNVAANNSQLLWPAGSWVNCSNIFIINNLYGWLAVEFSLFYFLGFFFAFCCLPNQIIWLQAKPNKRPQSAAWSGSIVASQMLNTSGNGVSFGLKALSFCWAVFDFMLLFDERFLKNSVCLKD